MAKRSNILLVLLILSIGLYAQSGQVQESLKMKSKILGKEVEYSIYLPPGYEKNTDRYPVLYLLHGHSGDESNWIHVGAAKETADVQLKEKKIVEMIIVMPDGGNSWYINSYDGKVLYEDFFVNEFINYIDETYRTEASREGRGIAGLSMGGHGSLLLAIRHPSLFSTVAPMSAAVFTQDELVSMTEKRWNNYFSVSFGKSSGVKRLNAHVMSNWVPFLVEHADVEALKKIDFYIDCGDDDFLIKGNMQLHALFLDKKIPHEFRVRDGVHDWNYWRTALPEVLKFVSASFQKQ